MHRHLLIPFSPATFLLADIIYLMLRQKYFYNRSQAMGGIIPMENRYLLGYRRGPAVRPLGAIKLMYTLWRR